MYLSKSKYVSGCQCPKILWMNEHMPDKLVSTIDESVVAQGNEVGDLAMGYFGDFVEIPYERGNYEGMAAKTRELINAGTPVICEATFIYEGNFCMVDILRVEPDGVHLVEVKSSTSVKDHYFDDVAYQYWVLEQCGLDVKSASLMHVNNQYVREGELDLQGLFTIEDLTEQVIAKQDEVERNIAYFDEYCAQKEEPILPMSPKCNDPFDCGYYGWCWRDLVHPGITDIFRMRKEKKSALYNQGLRTYQDVLDAGVELNLMQMDQVFSGAYKLSPIVDPEAIAEWLGGLRYPLYFLDFETFKSAVPIYDGTRPYQQITTQYSLHILDAPGGTLEHREFLADEHENPMRQVAEHLVGDMPPGACTLAWSMSFERGRIEEMANLFPDLAEHLMGIHDGIMDLGDPFKNHDYYTREMNGSWSIKVVLPALFPDDPELDYHALEGVHHGGEAMGAYQRLSGLEEDEREAVREQLLRYCELDTLAMVKILEKLYEIVEEERA